MVDVIRNSCRKAYQAGHNAPYKIAGKTGAAQVSGLAEDKKYAVSKIAEKLRDHALFVAFAPAQAPQIAVAVIVENGGGELNLIARQGMRLALGFGMTLVLA
jgi:penicillin-binding protein 2